MEAAKAFNHFFRSRKSDKKLPCWERLFDLSYFFALVKSKNKAFSTWEKSKNGQFWDFTWDFWSKKVIWPWAFLGKAGFEPFFRVFLLFIFIFNFGNFFWPFISCFGIIFTIFFLLLFFYSFIFFSYFLAFSFFYFFPFLNFPFSLFQIFRPRPKRARQK